MSRWLATAFLVLGAAALPVRTQRPTVEVASIKRNVSVSDRAFVRSEPGGRLSVGNNTLRNIIRNAYRLQNFQIVGGPDWINAERWDIVARADGNAKPEELLLMLQNLLADRFKLVVHREMRESPIYALVLARPDGRLGPQLKVSTTDCATMMAAARASGVRPAEPVGGGPLCGTRTIGGRMMTSATTMADLARSLSPIAGRSVVDKSGLTANFDLEMTWTPEPPPGAAGADAPRPGGDDTVSLFTAIQEQLGLKLEAQRGPVEVLVIDSVERPVED